MTASVKCTVCQHPQSVRINLALFKKPRPTDSAVASQYGVGRMSVFRHRTLHLPGQLVEDLEKLEPQGAAPPGTNLLAELLEAQASLKRLALKAERAGDRGAAITAWKEFRSIAEQKGRIRGELAPEPSGARDTALIVMDSAAAERALNTWAQRRSDQPVLPAAPVGDETAIDVELSEGSAT
jgi:hypothetical protein